MGETMTRHELFHFFSDEMNWCGCGMPENSAILIRDILRLLPLYDHHEEFKELIQPEAAAYIILYQMDAANLIEHGGTVGGAWITPFGQSVLELLNGIRTEKDWGEVFLNGSDPPPESCPICYPPVKANEVN